MKLNNHQKKYNQLFRQGELYQDQQEKLFSSTANSVVPLLRTYLDENHPDQKFDITRTDNGIIIREHGSYQPFCSFRVDGHRINIESGKWVHQSNTGGIIDTLTLINQLQTLTINQYQKVLQSGVYDFLKKEYAKIQEKLNHLEYKVVFSFFEDYLWDKFFDGGYEFNYEGRASLRGQYFDCNFIELSNLSKTGKSFSLEYQYRYHPYNEKQDHQSWYSQRYNLTTFLETNYYFFLREYKTLNNLTI